MYKIFIYRDGLFDEINKLKNTYDKLPFKGEKGVCHWDTEEEALESKQNTAIIKEIDSLNVIKLSLKAQHYLYLLIKLVLEAKCESMVLMYHLVIIKQLQVLYLKKN